MLLLTAACHVEAPVERPRFAVEVHLTDDGHEGLQGATIFRDGRALGTTNAEGRLPLTFAAPEGQDLKLKAQCPAGFVDHKVEAAVRLTMTRHVGSHALEAQRVELTCSKAARGAVLVVRAPGGENLPVRINGETAGVTDAGGNAHISMEVRRDVRAVEVELDTSGKKQLTPQNPRRLFALDGRDAVLVLEQSFSVPRRQKAPAAPAPPASAQRHIPTRID